MCYVIHCEETCRMSLTNISVCELILTYHIFHSTLLTCTVSRETSQEAENIDEQPLAQVTVGAKKSTQDPLPAIDAILPITGKYLITYI